MNSSRRKPAVAVACSSPSWGGMEMQTVVSAKELAGRGYAVSLLTAPGTRLGDEGRSAGVDVFPVLSKGYVAPFAVVRTVRLLRERSIDLVHAEFSKDLWTLVPAAGLAGGVPVLLTKRLASSVNKTDPLHRFLYRRTARVIAISSAVEANLRKRTPLRPEQIVRIPNGVDLSRFPRELFAERARVRREIGIPPDAPAVALVGRISRGKGHMPFLRAAPMVASRYPDARFLIVGSVTLGEEGYAEDVRSAAAETALGDRVLFTGFCEQIPRLLAAIDILVVPSRSEALGNVVLEGMAASLPVAAASRAGIRDLVIDGETGLLFDPDRPEEIAAAVLRLLEDEELRRSMGAHARKRAEETFSLEWRTDSMERLYHEVLTEKKREGIS